MREVWWQETQRRLSRPGLNSPLLAAGGAVTSGIPPTPHSSLQQYRLYSTRSKLLWVQSKKRCPMTQWKNFCTNFSKNRLVNFTNPSGSKDVVPCQSCCSLDSLWPCRSQRLYSFCWEFTELYFCLNDSNGVLQQLCLYFCKILMNPSWKATIIE